MRRLFLLFLTLAILVIVPFLIWGGSIEERMTLEKMVSDLQNSGRSAWAVGIGLLLIDLLLPILGTVVMSALGVVYGFFWGGVLGSVGSVGAGVLAYGLCRKFGNRAGRWIAGEDGLKSGEALFAGSIGGWVVALSRWLPVMPEVVACMAGLVKMPFRRFFAALCCGSIPMAFAFAWIGVEGRENPTTALICSIVIPPILWLIVKGLSIFKPKTNASLIVVFAALLSNSAFGFEPSYELSPINYSEKEAVTSLTKIADKIKPGTDRDILEQVLELLEIPVESQVLVYSKTSAQNSRISPKRPRAIYFSDNAYIGWVQGGDIEAMTFDENLGAIFHRIHLNSRELQKPPTISRDRSCLNCHGGSATSNFPGGLVRSVFPEASGQPIFHAGTFRTEPDSPLEERWGGWYVTGKSGDQKHMGNLLATELDDREISVSKIKEGEILDLQEIVDCAPYPGGGTSDIVALMILEHQIAAHNALTQGNLVARQTLHRHREMRKAFGESEDDPLSETNQRVLEGQANRIVKALFFADEFEMKNDGVDGSLGFQKAFAKNAKKDSENRSLKDLRLFERLFKYRCSYLVYSEAFEHLPEELKMLVLKQMHGVLTDSAAWPDFEYLTSSERRRILNILSETVPEWKTKQPY